MTIKLRTAVLFALLGAVAVAGENQQARREEQEFWQGMIEDASSFTPPPAPGTFYTKRNTHV
jgi:hypothetical protein